MANTSEEYVKSEHKTAVLAAVAGYMAIKRHRGKIHRHEAIKRSTTAQSEQPHGLSEYTEHREGVMSAMAGYLSGKMPHKRKGRPVGIAGQIKRSIRRLVRSNIGDTS